MIVRVKVFWIGLFLTVTDFSTGCHEWSSSETKWFVSRQLMVSISSYWPDWSITWRCHWTIILKIKTYLWNDSWVQTVHSWKAIIAKNIRKLLWQRSFFVEMIKIRSSQFLFHYKLFLQISVIWFMYFVHEKRMLGYKVNKVIKAKQSSPVHKG